MHYPDALQPDTLETIVLPSGRHIDIPKTRPQFQLWTGTPIADRYGKKTILSLNGEPVFAELAILRLCQHDGWDGVWVDTFGKAYRRGYWQPKDTVELPMPQRTLLQRIYAQAGSTKGCWDVVCWKDNRILFAEAKRQAQDRIRDTQRIWLEAALDVGIPISSFLIIEWTVQTRGSGDG
jgi:hypothetical protein